MRRRAPSPRGRAPHPAPRTPHPAPLMTRRYVCRMTRPTAGAHMTRRRARRTAARPAAAPRLRRARLTAYYTRTLRHSYTPTLLRHAYTPPTRLHSYRHKRYRPRRAAAGTGSRPGLKALTCPVHMPCQCTCQCAHVRPTSARAKTAQGQAKAKARARYCVHGTARRVTPPLRTRACPPLSLAQSRRVNIGSRWCLTKPHDGASRSLAMPHDASLRELRLAGDCSAPPHTGRHAPHSVQSANDGGTALPGQDGGFR